MALKIEQSKEEGLVFPNFRTNTVQGRDDILRFPAPNLDPIVVTSRLLAQSLARATRQGPTWEKAIAQHLPTAEPAAITDTVLKVNPDLNPFASRQRDIEDNLRRATAIITATNAAHLLIQLRLGIPSTQAMKREARTTAQKTLRTANGKTTPKKFTQSYDRELRQTKKYWVEQIQPDNPYFEWRKSLKEKAGEAHLQCENFKDKLEKIKKGGV